MPTNTIPFSVITSILWKVSKVSRVFFLQDDRVSIHRVQEVTEKFDEPENNVNLTPQQAKQQALNSAEQVRVTWKV